MINNEVRINWNIINRKPVVAQLNEQGYAFTGRHKDLPDNLYFSIHLLYLQGIISGTDEDKLLKKVTKRLLELIKKIE